MTDPIEAFKALRRPCLLVRAARLGLADYSRARDLPRLLRSAPPPGPGRAAGQLMQMEQQLEDLRRSDRHAYSASRHVAVMIALMAEMALLARPDSAAG